MRTIATELPAVEVITPPAVNVTASALEASHSRFRLQMLRGRQGNIPSVTGATAPGKFSAN